MKDKKFAVTVSAMVLMLASNIFLAARIVSLEKAVSALEVKTDGFGKSLAEFQAHADVQAGRIQKDLGEIAEKADMQFSRTVGMSRTYDALLSEQKKKTVDTTSLDNAVESMRREAKKHFAEKKYSLAYNEFKKVLSYQKDDMESRLNKMKSLYYKNRADSSSYSEILEDIRILRANGYLDGEATQIETLVTAEREGLND
jgi:hypothetical protein